MTCFLSICLLFQPATPPASAALPFRLEQIVNDQGEPLPNGYIVYLDRASAEMLSSFKEMIDEEAVAKQLGTRTKDLKTKLFIHFAKANYKQLKVDLREKLGTEGVKITVTGGRPLDLLVKDRTQEDRDRAKDRERLIQSVLPPKLRAAHSMINTVPARFVVQTLGDPVKSPPAEKLPLPEPPGESKKPPELQTIAAFSRSRLTTSGQVNGQFQELCRSSTHFTNGRLLLRRLRSQNPLACCEARCRRLC